MTPAIKFLQRMKAEFAIHEYSHCANTESYGLEACEKLGVSPYRVFKTLVTKLDSNQLVVAIIPVAQKLNLKQVAKTLKSKKAKMAEKAEVERATGYVLGGVSPLGQRKLLPSLLHQSAKDFSSIYISAGKRGLEVEIAPVLLCQLAKGEFADIAVVK